MSTHGTVRLKMVMKMLKNCAEGYSIEVKKHYLRIYYNGLIYPSFPKGGHGESNPEIQRGHVKDMIKHLGIDPNCAKSNLPFLQ